MNTLLDHCLNADSRQKFTQFENLVFHKGLVKLVKLLHKQKIEFTWGYTLEGDIVVNTKTGQYTFTSYSEDPTKED